MHLLQKKATKMDQNKNSSESTCRHRFSWDIIRVCINTLHENMSTSMTFSTTLSLPPVIWWVPKDLYILTTMFMMHSINKSLMASIRMTEPDIRFVPEQCQADIASTTSSLPHNRSPVKNYTSSVVENVSFSPLTMKHMKNKLKRQKLTSKKN